jgi:long-chain-fatty-acid--CoA ligase ACSBG
MSITGRIKELIITAGGENIPPVLIGRQGEGVHKAVSNVIVIGDQRKVFTVLLTLRVNMDVETQSTPNVGCNLIGCTSRSDRCQDRSRSEKRKASLKRTFDAQWWRWNGGGSALGAEWPKWVLLDKDFRLE